MDGATSHVLEITVISAEELYLSRRQPVKRNAFTVVNTDNEASGFRRTTIDKDGGSNPFWNEKFELNLPMHGHINIEVQCKSASGDNIIGAVNIPKTDFLGGYVPLGYLHNLSYRLRDRNGQRNGIINVSVRVKTPANVGFGSGFSKPCSSHMTLDYEVSTPVVTGVPIRQKH